MNGIPSLAQSVQSQGRGNDTQLVHMTPREVQGLESLAMAYGGSLTTNPRTGLKEAGFLDNILPTIAGIGLSFVPGVGPLMAAGLVGGGTALATGNLEKGLMAGLGAYGGAGLGGALAGTGAATAAGAAGAGSAGASMAPGATGSTLSTLTGAPASAGMSTVGPGTSGLLAANPVTAATTAGVPLPTGAAAAGQGITALGSEAGRSTFMNQVGGLGGLAKYGGAAIVPALLSSDRQSGVEPDAGTMRPYTYDAGRQDVQYRTGEPGESTSEQQYFTPTFTPLPTYTPGSGSAAELEDERRRMGYAKGGEVEDPNTYRTGVTGEATNVLRYAAPEVVKAAAPAGAMGTNKTLFNLFSDLPRGQRRVTPEEYLGAMLNTPLFGSLFGRGTQASQTPQYEVRMTDPSLQNMGVMALAAGSQGPVRMLRGGGDATSDSMDGVIDDKEPVRLATGEVVIDGRAVSEIGNGDNESGAKKIEAAIDRIHKIRQKAKRGKPSSADKTFASMIA